MMVRSLPAEMWCNLESVAWGLVSRENTLGGVALDLVSRENTSVGVALD